MGCCLAAAAGSAWASPRTDQGAVAPAEARADLAAQPVLSTTTVAVDEPLRLDFNPGLQDLVTSSARPVPPKPIDAARPIAGKSARHEDGSVSRPVRKSHPVPEPASIVLVVTGFIGLAARRYLQRHPIQVD